MKKIGVIFLLLVSFLLGAMAHKYKLHDLVLAEKKPVKVKPVIPVESPFTPIVRNEKLPSVLLIGDSISIGYTIPVRKLLANEFNVERIPANSRNTVNVLRHLDDWIPKNKKYDVIHFNVGLHDLMYVSDKEDITDVAKGRQWTPIQEYKKNMREIIRRLKQTGARLVFATSTPVPEGSRGRIASDVAKYNAVAVELMHEYQVPVNDLYRFSYPLLTDLQEFDDPHFNKAGSWLLGKVVAEHIRAVMRTR